MAGDNVTGTLILPASQFESLAATGTPPLIVASATVVTDLNADLLDGLHADAFGQLAQANRWTAQQSFDLAPLPQTHLGPALGSASRRWNNAYIGGLDASGNATIAGTLGVTGAITGTLATPAQPNITSLGTLSALTVSGAASIAKTLVVGAAPLGSAGDGDIVVALSRGLRVGAVGQSFRIIDTNAQGVVCVAGAGDRVVCIGTENFAGAGSGDAQLANNKHLRWLTAAGTASVPALKLNASDAVELNLNAKPLEITSRATVSTVSAGASLAVPATPAAWVAISLGGAKFAFPVYNAT